jgi:DNA-directed RNA polymerase
MRVTTGLFRIDRGWKRDGRKFKRELTVVARPETLEWLSERHGHLEFMTPVRLPMVVPPLPWGQGQRGGYRFAYRFARQLMYPLVRRSHSDGTVEVADEIEQLDMPAVYEALNAVQETAWRINADVLRLVRELQNRGVEVAKFPSWENEPLPAKPANFDELDPAHAARRDWRYRAGLVHNENQDAVRRAAGGGRGRVLPAIQHRLPGQDVSPE